MYNGRMRKIVTMLAFVGSALPVLCWILTMDPALKGLGSRLVLTAFLAAPVALAKLDVDGLAETGNLVDLRTFLSCAGCAGRAEYWTAVMFVLTLDIFVASLSALLLAPFLKNAAGFGLFILLVDAVALSAVAVRRLHDFDRPGWWVLLFWVLVPAAFHCPLHPFLVLAPAALLFFVLVGALPPAAAGSRFEAEVRTITEEEMRAEAEAEQRQLVYGVSTGAADPKATLGAYLANLSEKHERGEISEEDYTAQVNALMGGADAASAPADTWLPLEERVQRTVTSSKGTRYLMLGTILLALVAIAGSLFFLRWFSRAME